MIDHRSKSCILLGHRDLRVTKASGARVALFIKLPVRHKDRTFRLLKDAGIAVGNTFMKIRSRGIVIVCKKRRRKIRFVKITTTKKTVSLSIRSAEWFIAAILKGGKAWPRN